MNYFSCFSGIEAASVAWKPLGWKAVGFSEIEPFPSAVLAHRFPNIKNYGDITKYNEWGIAPGSVDLVVGGSPCQAFSIAGLRQGLVDPRGNLALVFLGLVDRLRPRWVIWENVPGVLSSNGGEDFAAFLSALGQLGYGWSYRVLDAQYFGVPQRRRRVFLVASSTGDWRPCAEVLSVAEGLRGYIEESGEKGKAASCEPKTCAGINCEQSATWWDGGEIADTLTRKGAGGDQRMPDKGNFGALLEPNQRTTRSVTSKWSKGSGGPAGDESANIIAEIKNPSHWDGGPHPTLNQSNKSNGAPGYSNQEIFSQGGGGLVPSEPNPLMFKVRGGVEKNSGVQGGVPGQGAGKGYLGSENKAFTVASTQDQWLAQPVYPIHDQATRFAGKRGDKQDGKGNGLGIGKDGDPAPTLTKGDKHAVAQMPMAVRRLTPVECERLQGFPDNWTLIPWKGRPPEECPDGPRYKACGNSMAVPVMAWIGKQIANYEASQK